ncbi:MAG: 4-aminobutyrate aminotransferase / (S)-3-amino-2-methylpropionate transaminase / 5-aminovalerate [Candidatus Eremiobacteraeota bacterium]|nr:4-aminobutyrate aminotransferase / (S)-3-amino-2-methylpropionate transaminase / 5-aminovalerate [Candidatus Eremiobacteraeota bacterium]
MIETRKTIELRTSVPGPNSRALSERRSAAVARGVASGLPVYVASAHGATVTDVDGNVFLDFTGGIGVQNAGHTPASVTAAIAAQAARFVHTCFMVAPYEPYVDVCERLARLAPGSAAKKAALFSSGAEALENAVKIARAHTGRDAIVVFSHGYHGRTNLTMAMTAKNAPYKRGFGPFAPEIYRAPLPYPFRGVSAELALARLEELVEVEVGAERLAAIVIEPVAGEGGFIPVPFAFLRAIRALCDRTGAVMVADEVQTGFGRTGTMFACEQADVEPDLIAVAKSLAAGMPLSGVVGKAEIVDAPGPSGLGGTYGGNPVACAAAVEAMKLIEDPAFLARAREIGETVTARFRAWQSRFPGIGDVRGIGPMVAFELVADDAAKTPDGALTARIHRAAYERGLMLVKAGTYDNVIRFLAPLVISDEQLAEGLAVLEDALVAATA